MPCYECEGYERETDVMEQNSHRVPRSRKMRVASRAVHFFIIINFENFSFRLRSSAPTSVFHFVSLKRFIVWVMNNGGTFSFRIFAFARKSSSAIRSTSTNLCVTPFVQSQPRTAILVDYSVRVCYYF